MSFNFEADFQGKFHTFRFSYITEFKFGKSSLIWGSKTSAMIPYASVYNSGAMYPREPVATPGLRAQMTCPEGY